MANCIKCINGHNLEGRTCEYCYGTGYVYDGEYDDCEYDDFQPCNNCDLPDACADFCCAIKQGLRRDDSIF